MPTDKTPKGDASSPPGLLARCAIECVAFALAVIGPVVHATHSGWDGSAIAIWIVAAVASVVIGLVRPVLVRVAIAAIAAVVVAVATYKLIGAWLGAGLLFADWTVRRRPPIPRLPKPGVPASIGGSVMFLMVARRARNAEFESNYTAYLLLAGLAVVIVVMASIYGHKVDRFIAVVKHVVGHLVTVIAFGLLSVVAILTPALVQRLLGSSPLRPPSAFRGRWLAKDIPSKARRSWSKERPLRGPVVLRLLAPFIVIGLGMGSIRLYEIIRGYEWKPQTGSGFNLGGDAVVVDEETPAGVPLAQKGQSWYAGYRDEIGWMINQETAFRPLAPIRLVDVEGRYVNIAGGKRATWKSPEATDQALTVWVYGGSTTFGLDQRDDHTIPSELARRAAEDGLYLNVVNRGVVGDMHWQEADRFAWDLTVEAAPDLVVFYDGVNEIWGTNVLQNQRIGDVPYPIEPLTEDIWGGILRTNDAPAPDAPPGARLVPTERVPAMTDVQLGTLTGERFLRSRLMSAASARAYDVAAAWFWQPSRVSRPFVAGEYGDDSAADEHSRQTYAAATEAATSDGSVTDLSDVLDPYRQPLFTDDVHHNEEAARIIADAMYDRLEAQLRAITETKGAEG